ncbi:Hpt domain protein [Roseivivax sp. THAF40]|uniref:Hpt domain-containing protein n=1 Tax=unclassified Roseivivax TaxID=2639302 RepID=UPI0012AA79E1|nr:MULTISPECIES: Hpt domain-containing protein [unclassified Roseivivax]QFS83734.1 Hpt domain protein [Roseivivax sp. THAF197b]QFT47536.1 Hpt domain protein [Roseivivax sp. THAF40]
MRLGFLKKLTGRGRAAATDGPEPGNTGAVIDTPGAPDPIDLARLGELKQVLPEDAVRTLVQTFLSETEAELPVPPIAAEDTAATARVVHKIAGSAAVLGAHRFHAALGTAEAALRENQVALSEAGLEEAHRIWAITKARLEALDIDAIQAP